MELERLDKYELLERLGQGGMGEVWKARDTQLRRYVAIKFLHANLQSNPDFVTQFMREARFVASLHHPNIIEIHDFQLTDARGSGTAAYMVMDYVEGGTMADYIRGTSRKGLFPVAADIVYLFTSISLALDYAHQKGMIHRDIKPANILLDKRVTTGKPIGDPILTDFGIAKLQGGSSSTMTHTGIGTPLYISPEQAQGQTADEHSDLYSLGIILYEVMTGITPFRGDNPISIMMQHINEVPPPPTLINPRVSAELSAVILRSIAKEPDARFATASEMTIALAQALQVADPSRLRKPGNKNGQPEYNPLQPSSPLSGMIHQSPILTSSPAAAFTPSSTRNTQAQLNMPPQYADARNNQALQSPALTPPALSQAKPGGTRRNLYIGLIACVVLLLGGIGVFAVPRLLSQQNAGTTQNTTASFVGHVTFRASPGSPPNSYDQLQITLNNIPSPPAGKSYYAWLEKANSETGQLPHWSLQVTNGAVQGIYKSNTLYGNLLTKNTTFLVTAEDMSITTSIPSPNLNTHLYYADISSQTTANPTFEVKKCPAIGSNSCN